MVVCKQNKMSENIELLILSLVQKYSKAPSGCKALLMEHRAMDVSHCPHGVYIHSMERHKL
jgi:hypothetical protein